MNRRDFLRLSAFAVAATGAPSMLKAEAVGGNAFRTTLRKALIEKRLTAKVCDRLQAAGFPGVELTDKTVSIADARAARRLAEERGINIHSFMGAWFEFNADDPAVRQAAIAAAKQAIRLTAAYGAPVMLVVPGRISGMAMPAPDAFKISFDSKTMLVDRVADGDNAPYAAYIAAQNAATRRTYEAFEELVPVAAEEGVVLAIENVWNNLWVTPDFAAAFCRSFASPWVKFYFDIGNHTRYSAATKWLEVLSDQIVKLHIKDFAIDRTDPKHGKFVRIGEGSIDFKAVRRAIDKIGYSGWVSIESSGWTDKEHSEIMDRFFDGKL